MSTKQKILLDHTDTPTKRMLVQDAKGIHVLSECCAAKLWQKHGWYECVKCAAQVLEVGRGFVTSIRFDEVVQWSWDKNPTDWKDWLKCFFEIEDGAILFEDLDEFRSRI